jgi:transcriptional regulator with XRE-family HTH domain
MSTRQRSAPTTVAPTLSSIKRARLEKNVTVRGLASRLGVTPGAVSQMERSEARGSIQIATLSRALAALETQPSDEARPPLGRYRVGVEFDRREDRVAFELHRAVAKKLIDDPDAVRAVIPANVAKIRRHVRGPFVNGWLDKWEALGSAPVGTLVEALLATDDEGVEMRQNGPFMGVLTQQERLDAIARAAR